MQTNIIENANVDHFLDALRSPFQRLTCSLTNSLRFWQLKTVGKLPGHSGPLRYLLDCSSVIRHAPEALRNVRAAVRGTVGTISDSVRTYPTRMTATTDPAPSATGITHPPASNPQIDLVSASGGWTGRFRGPSAPDGVSAANQKPAQFLADIESVVGEDSTAADSA